ncbi:hypothetical protein ABWK22_17075 [Gottfriedia acidiceleris]|uniref:tetratricopeptide repeat protein n=1 Tax=Gottfriedia acidiceleris TaxID=371036 RepID=UPI00339B41DC
MELNDEIYDKIVELSEEGDALFEAQDFIGAIKKFKNALELIPEPKYMWEASTWVFTALGDVYFHLEDYHEAKNYFYDAFNCPEGMGNPYILLRLGQNLYENCEKEKAKEYLLKAYMLEGQDIFEEEDPKYIKLIQELI